MKLSFKQTDSTITVTAADGDKTVELKRDRKRLRHCPSDLALKELVRDLDALLNPPPPKPVAEPEPEADADAPPSEPPPDPKPKAAAPKKAKPKP